LAHLNLGRPYRQWDERQLDARRELQQVTELGEDYTYTQAGYELGMLDLDANELQSAVTLLKKSALLFDALDEERASRVANLQLGRAFLAQQNRDDARGALEKAKQYLAVFYDSQNQDDIELSQEIESELARLESLPE